MKPKKRQCRGYKDIIGYKPNIQNPAILMRADISGHLPQKQKIVAEKARVCELEQYIANDSCQGMAYRKVYTKYGLKFCCNECAKKLALDNEAVWSETVKFHFNNAKEAI